MRHVLVLFALVTGLPALALGQSDSVAESGRAASSAERSAAGAPAVLRQALPAVVTIRTYDRAGDEIGLGSGFFLRDGRVATNSHVVAGASWVEVLDHDGNLRTSATHAEALSTRLDLAILPAPGRGAGTNGLALRAELPEIGESVWVIGSPQGLNSSVSNGVVSAVREVEGQRLIQLTAPISRGSSGGPIMDENGRVVGVTVATLASGQNLNFGVPSRDLIVLARSEPAQLAFPSASKRDASSTTDSEEDDELYAGLESLLSSAREVSLGRRSGRLTSRSVQIQGRYFEAFKYSGRTGERLVISLESEEFDPYLLIVGNDGNEYWSEADDDGGDGLNSLLEVTLPATGAYYIFISSYDGDMGRFELRIDRASSGRQSSGGARSARTGDRWEHVITDAEDATWWWDPQSVRRTGTSYHQAWVREVLPNPEGYGAERYDTKVILVELQCSTGRIRILQSTTYLSGRSVQSESIPVWQAEWFTARPESVGEAMIERICT